MKKLLLLTLALALTFSLAGCTKKTEGADAAPTPTADVSPSPAADPEKSTDAGVQPSDAPEKIYTGISDTAPQDPPQKSAPGQSGDMNIVVGPAVELRPASPGKGQGSTTSSFHKN